MPVARRQEPIFRRPHRPGGVRGSGLVESLPASGPAGRGSPAVPEVREGPRGTRRTRRRADSTTPGLVAPPNRRDALGTDSGTEQTEQKAREAPAGRVGPPVVSDVRGGRG